jgi:hypothetical protein
MAGITILPREQSSGSQIGQAFGTGLSSGIQNTLQQLANQRANRIYAQNVGQGLRALLPDLTQEQALAAGYVPEKILSQFVQQKMATQFPVEGTDIGQFIKGLTPEQLNAFKASSPGVQNTLLRGLIEDPYRFIEGYGQESGLAQKLAPLISYEAPKYEEEINPTQQITKPEIKSQPRETELSLPERTAQIRNQLIRTGVPPKQATATATKLATAEKEKPETAATVKHRDSLVAAYDNLDDIINTTSRMLKTLKNPQFEYGILPGLKGQFAPTQLPESSELFDKDAAHIVNLTSENIKGVPSRHRVKLIEKEKPGLHHSLPVNEQILKRLNENAKTKKRELLTGHPEIEKIIKTSPLEGLSNASKYPEGTPATNPRTGQKAIIKNGQWVLLGE